MRSSGEVSCMVKEEETGGVYPEGEGGKVGGEVGGRQRVRRREKSNEPGVSRSNPKASKSKPSSSWSRCEDARVALHATLH